LACQGNFALFGTKDFPPQRGRFSPCARPANRLNEPALPAGPAGAPGG
jgi:hypothetical protein